jgi:hypothetical protein
MPNPSELARAEQKAKEEIIQEEKEFFEKAIKDFQETLATLFGDRKEGERISTREIEQKFIAYTMLVDVLRVALHATGTSPDVVLSSEAAAKSAAAKHVIIQMQALNQEILMEELFEKLDPDTTKPN